MTTSTAVCGPRDAQATREGAMTDLLHLRQRCVTLPKILASAAARGRDSTRRSSGPILSPKAGSITSLDAILEVCYAS